MRVIFVLAFTLYFSYYGSAQIKVLPLSNSITQGMYGPNTYRRYLWNLLSEVGYQVYFIGSIDKTSGAINFLDTYFELDHEGHWDDERIK